MFQNNVSIKIDFKLLFCNKLYVDQVLTKFYEINKNAKIHQN